VIDGVVGQHARLDALVNAAGGYAGGVKSLGGGDEGPRSNAGVEFALRLRVGARSRACDAKAGAGLDRET
jgi:hypothetical protein